MKYMILAFTLFFASFAHADIEWSTYSEKALAQAQSSGQKVLLGFHKKGCGTCAAQDAALVEKGIKQAKNVVFLYVERKDKSLTGVYEKYGLNQRQWAALVLLDENGNELAKVPAGTRSGPSLDNLLSKL